VRRQLAIALACGVVALAATPPATASGAALTARAAKHALRVNLARGFDIRRVSAVCRRRSRMKFSCRWRGTRNSVRYRGHAVIVRAGRRTSVQLSDVHRV
jgi:Ni/Co efflux regulator RcnB